jgi:type IV secretion system protein VirB10
VSTATPKATDRSLGDLNFLITKGTFIEAVMETAMSSDQPGMLKALVTTDVYGANGKVVLLERGTRLVGEFKGQLRNGQARVFCLWTRAETPKGIIINLDSGAADALGRSGLDGDIDHHWTLRLGTAMLLSTWSDTLQALMAIQRQGGDNTYYNFDSSSRTSQDLATEALKPYINIPPTLLKNHGEPVRVFVARDLDFRNVYQLGITDQPGIQFVSAPLPATFDPPAPLAPQTRPSASPESSADSVVLSPGQSARQNAR